MRALALAFFLALAGGQAGAAPLTVNSFAQPGSIASGQLITVIVQVTNPGPGQYFDVSTTVEAFSSLGGASVLPFLTPAPSSQDIAFSDSKTFTWVYQGQNCGSVSFSSWATGWDGATGLTSTAGPHQSGPVLVVCTPSPTPSLTSTTTATPVLSSTPTPTVTPTDWIIYGTPTAVPLVGDAIILGNLFHPDKGQPLQLRFDAPMEGIINIEIYGRLGNKIKHLQRTVLPGRYTELWDGRGDDGLLVSSGVYVAHFRGKGLNRSCKFAVVR